jgi:hypothetical protein
MHYISIFLWGIFALFSGRRRRFAQKSPKKIEHFA